MIAPPLRHRSMGKTMPRCLLSTFVGMVFLSATASAQAPIALAERFDTSEPYRVELKVRLAGRLALPVEPGKPPQVLPVIGASTLTYDERPLPRDGEAARVVRSYREVEFVRTLDGREQKAEVRPAVRRMVVLRSEKGKKAPFSPDGPLTWSEIDAVRTDIFSPALVAGLLPAKAVRPGDRWPATPAAMSELTDHETVEEGGLTVEYLSAVQLNGKSYAKLGISGTVKGATQDGPSKQTLEGLAYFDIEANRLTYLNLKGTHELLSAEGKVTGRIDGTFVMTRGPAGKTDDLSDAVLRTLELRPGGENTLLLYDNPDLGVKFLYPRRWRAGLVQGRQLTVDESGGGGLLLTIEPPATLPGIDDYFHETKNFLKQQQWAVLATDAPRRVADKPAKLDRFGFDADVKKEKVRLEYAVVSQPEGGVTAAARLPWNEREELGRDLERILRSVVVTRRVGK